MRYSIKPYDISGFSEEIYIGKEGTALSYPSFVIDGYNNIHLICRKQDMNNLSPSHPSLNYFKIEINNGFRVSIDNIMNPENKTDKTVKIS